MRRPRPLGAALAVGLLSAAGGCAGPGMLGPDASLVPSSRPYEQDIPVPVGFRIVDQSSEDWSNGQVRYVRHRYRGRADTYAVRRFYREQMPLVRWTAISDGTVSGRITMRFQREAESCTVIIEDILSGLARRVEAEVLIAPSAR